MRAGRVALLVLAMLAVAAAARALRLSAFASHQRAARYEDLYYVPNPPGCRCCL